MAPQEKLPGLWQGKEAVIHGIRAGVQLRDVLPDLNERTVQPLLRAHISSWGQLVAIIESDHYEKGYLSKYVKGIGKNAEEKILAAVDSVIQSHQKTS